MGRDCRAALQDFTPIAARFGELNACARGCVVVDRHVVPVSNSCDEISGRLLDKRKDIGFVTVLGKPLTERLVVRNACDLDLPTLGKSTLNNARLRHAGSPSRCSFNSKSARQQHAMPHCARRAVP
jgi:hypothetical protein